MTRAKKVSKLSLEFNEAQGKGDQISSSLIHELEYGTDHDQFEDGEVNTRYEVTVTVRELGDWGETGV